MHSRARSGKAAHTDTITWACCLKSLSRTTYQPVSTISSTLVYIHIPGTNSTSDQFLDTVSSSYMNACLLQNFAISTICYSFSYLLPYQSIKQGVSIFLSFVVVGRWHWQNLKSPPLPKDLANHCWEKGQDQNRLYWKRYRRLLPLSIRLEMPNSHIRALSLSAPRELPAEYQLFSFSGSLQPQQDAAMMAVSATTIPLEVWHCLRC